MAKKDSKAKSSRPAPAPKSAPAARDLGATLGQTIRGAAPDIVNALIEQAKAGNSTPAKFLFEFAGLTSSAAPDAQAEESLAARLLRELEACKALPGSEEAGTVQ